MSIPLIDLAAFRRGTTSARRSIAETVDFALRDNGFLLVRGHAVSDDLVTSLLRTSGEFFALPAEEKLRVAQPSQEVLRGYVAMGRESLSNGSEGPAPPDLNESFMIGQPDARKTDRGFAENLWPARPAEMKKLWVEYYREMERVAGNLLQMFAMALGLREDFFDRSFMAHTSRLRARYYPRQSQAPQPGQFRAGAHTDWGSLAILLTEHDRSGLQVRQRSGQWLDVPTAAGCLIVNIGDMMARWTNDRWSSALHRVANPSRQYAAAEDRLSHIFFQSPSDDTLVQSLDVCCDAGQPAKYSPVLSGEYLRMKFQNLRSR